VAIDGVMDRLYIERNQIAARYLSGQLSDEEAQAFERAFLADPSLVDDVTLTARLRAGLSELNRRGDLAQFRAGRQERSRLLTPYGLAASVVAAVGIAASSYLYIENRARTAEVSALQSEVASLYAPQVIEQEVHLHATRGSSQQEVFLNATDAADAEIAAPSIRPPKWITLSIDATPFDDRPVTISLLDEAGRELWRRTDVRSPNGATFLLNVNSSRLTEDRYVVEIVGVGGESPQRFMLNVIRR
jgi:hypothetical protein